MLFSYLCSRAGGEFCNEVFILEVDLECFASVVRKALDNNHASGKATLCFPFHIHYLNNNRKYDMNGDLGYDAALSGSTRLGGGGTTWANEMDFAMNHAADTGLIT